MCYAATVISFHWCQVPVLPQPPQPMAEWQWQNGGVACNQGAGLSHPSPDTWWL